ncbi:MAG TPA: PAS domain S-box protein, partial [Methanomicrobiales archaeon]|nr:PAS domain S-box protein [Methanomicrobiales archaeon]
WIGFYEESRRSGNPVHFEYSDVRGGKETWLAATVNYLGTNPDGLPRFAYVVRDISEEKRAKEAVRENEERLRILYESMTEGLANHEVVYENGRAVDYIITDVNPAFERITGLTRSRALGKRASELYGAGGPPYLDVYARVAAGGGPETFETYFAPMKQHFSISAFSPGKGRFATVFTDITERKRSDEALRQLSQFPGQNPNPVMRIAGDGTLLYANEAAGRWLTGLGWSEDGPLPDSILALADSSRGDEREHQSEISDGQGRVSWLFAVRPPGEEYVNIYVRDITERKQAEEAMRESRERFRVLSENTPDMITRFDRDLHLLYANPAVLRRTGLSEEVMVGRTATEYGASPGAVAVWERAAHEVLDTGEHRRLEVANQWQGEMRVFDTQLIPEWDASGEVRAVIAIARDITERKMMEDRQQVTLQRFYSILSNMHTAILLVTDDNRVEFANQAFCDAFELTDFPGELVDLSADELIGKIRSSYIDPDGAVARIKEIVSLGQPVLGEDVGMRGERAFLRDFVPLRLGEKRFGRLWMHTDITERKKTEDELRRKQSEIQALFDNIPAGLVLFEADPQYRVLVHNRYYQELFAEPFQSQGMAGLSVYDYAPAVEAEGVVAVFDEVVRTKQAKRFLDFPYRSNPPNQTWFNWYMAPIILDGKVVALVSMSLDVTERHLAEQALRESEERFRTVADNTYDWEFWLDPAGKFVYCSPSCEMVTGHKPQEFIDHPGLRWDLIHPDDRARFEEHQREVHGKQGIGKGEWRYIRPDGTSCWVEHVCRPIYGGKGEFLGIRGSNRDITERKRAEEALRASEERFHAVATNTPDHILMQDRDLKYQLVINPQLGLTEEDMLGKTDYEILDREDAVKITAIKRTVLETGDAASLETSLRNPRGETEFFSGMYVPKFGPAGEVDGIIGYFRNTTESRRADQALRESEERYRVLVDSAPVAIVVHFHGRPLYANQVALDLYGASSLEELQGHDIMKLLPPVEQEIADDRVRGIDEGKRLPMREGVILRLDGTEVPIEVVSSPIRYEGTLAALVLMRDIADRKKAEEKIAHLASFPEMNPNPILELDQAGEVIYTNSAVVKILENLGLGKKVSAFLPEDLPYLLPRLLEGDIACEITVGERVFIETITLNPQTRTIRIYARDITDRKHAEEALRETSQYLENLLNHANTPIIVWDPKYRITRFNHAFERLTGRPAERVLGKELDILFPQDTVASSMDHIRRTMAGERWEAVEIPILHRDGSVRTVLWNSATLYKADGVTVSSAIAQGQDITERKQFEEALHATSQYLENLIAYANAPIIVWDPDLRITRFNRAFERLTGRSAGEVVGKSLMILFPAEEAAGSMEHIQRAMAGERLETVEIPILTKDGDLRTVLWNSATLYEADGRTVSSAIAQGQDITDRKKVELELAEKAGELQAINTELKTEISHRKNAEETVRTTLSQLHAALESTADAMLVVSKQGRITSYNRNFTTMWNIPDSILSTLDTRAATEYLSMQVKDPDAFLARMQDLADHPQRESFDTLELLDGRFIERYSKAQRIGNSIVGRVFSFRDITERRRAEERLITSLEEKEVLLREIHHRVKNNLQLTSSLLDMTRMRTRDPGTGSILTDVMMKIQTMAQIHTRLYESKQFDRINMEATVREQLAAVSTIYAGKKTEITGVLAFPEIYMPIDQAIPCALVLNELLSNAYKHAFRGRERGTVEVSGAREGDRIRISVRDDGVGMPEGFDISRASSLGLKLVRNLVQQQLKGKLEIKRDGGTEVIVELPIVRQEREDVKDSGSG